MTTDRELLELAAKAAGIHSRWLDGANCLWIDKEKRIFDPLRRDDEALRLAVRLGIDLLFTAEDVEAVATQHARQDAGEMISPWACESWTLKQQDPHAATRRAIVRAAAEIGRAME